MADHDRVQRIRTLAWNAGMKDGWDRLPPRDIPFELATELDALRVAWAASYEEAYQEAHQAFLPFAD